jgi:hypothetical protein
MLATQPDKPFLLVNSIFDALDFTINCLSAVQPG